MSLLETFGRVPMSNKHWHHFRSRVDGCWWGRESMRAGHNIMHVWQEHLLHLSMLNLCSCAVFLSIVVMAAGSNAQDIALALPSQKSVQSPFHALAMLDRSPMPGTLD